MSVFHVGPNGPGKCSAESGNCPFGGESGIENHYTSEEAAVKAFESSMEKEAHAKVAKPKKPAKPKSFSDVRRRLYKSNYYGGASFTPMSHADLMAIPREEFKEYLDRVDESDPDTALYATLKKDKAIVSDQLKKSENSLKALGKKLGNSPEGLALASDIKQLTKDRDAINERMSSLNAYQGGANQYIMAKTAYEVTQPRVVDGISLAPGEGVVRGLYTTDGEFLGLVNFNMREPNQGFSAVASDGTRTPFVQKGNRPEARYEHLKEQGYVIGQAVVPVALYQDYDGSFHRGKTSPAALADNPAKPVPNFDRGPRSWANTIEKQEALIS